MRFSAKATVLAVVVGAAFALPPRHARAFIVECPTCSSLYTQGLELIKEGQSYEVEAQQLTTQLNGYVLLARNTAAIPTQLWNDAQNDIARVHALMNAGSMLGNDAGNMLNRMQNLSMYASQVGSLGNMTNQLQQWSSTSARTLQQLNSALGMTADNQAGDAAFVAAMEANASSATGQMQVMQAGAMFAGSTTSQLMKLNQLTSLEMQMQGEQMGQATDRQAASDQAVMNFLGGSDLPTNGNPRY